MYDEAKAYYNNLYLKGCFHLNSDSDKSSKLWATPIPIEKNISDTHIKIGTERNIFS